jgi:hypothetical protein
LFPFCVADVVKVSVGEAAPATLVKVVPPFVLTCHCTVGAGFPLAAAVKLTLLPAVTDWLTGCVVMAGAPVNVSVAAVVVAIPATLVNTAWYLFPFCPAVVANVSVVEIAPATLLNVAPPEALTCHWTVGIGLPLAAAVKLTLLPTLTI